MFALILAFPLLVAAPGPLEAQRPPEPEPIRPTRSLAVGNLAYFESATTVTAGYLYQVAFRTSRVERMPAGNTVERFPRYFAHMMGTAGAVWEDDDIGLAAYAQLGVARRNDHPTITAVGIATQWMYRPRAYGPVARVEIMDNLGLQGGWLFVDDDRGALFLSLDYMRDILRDLGLR